MTGLKHERLCRGAPHPEPIMFTAVLLLVLLYLAACFAYGGVLVVRNSIARKQRLAEEAAADAVIGRVEAAPTRRAA